MFRSFKESQVYYDVIIGPGSQIVGDIFCEGSVRVDGIVNGHVHALGQVIISEGATVNGDIVADSAEILGTCDGSILARGKVTLLSKSIVHGDIEAQSFTTIDGATFTGKCTINPLNTIEINIPALVNKSSKALPKTTEKIEDGDVESDDDKSENREKSDKNISEKNKNKK